MVIVKIDIAYYKHLVLLPELEITFLIILFHVQIFSLHHIFKFH